MTGGIGVDETAEEVAFQPPPEAEAVPVEASLLRGRGTCGKKMCGIDRRWIQIQINLQLY